MRRRVLFGGLAAVPWVAARAQTRSVPRIGFLIAGDPEPGWSLFRNAMTGLGYVEGQTVSYEYRAPGASGADMRALADGLVARDVDVIVAVLSPAIVAAKQATSRIPIVFYGAAPDIGGIDNVARPAGNITGVFSPSTTVAGKGLQLFHEIRPATRSFGLLLNEADPFHVPLRSGIEAVAEAEKIEGLPILIKSPDALPQAFETLTRRGVDGVLVQPSLGLETTAAMALKYRLPGISFRREFVDVGGLMSYGSNQADILRIAAGQVDRLLKGTRPADLPVQQASKFELVVNQKTARALDFVFPPLFLARVDETIE